MKRKFFAILLILIISISFNGCSKHEKSMVEKDKINIVVTFNALQEYAQAIGKDKVNVISIIPQGTEPHDFEPKIKDMKRISNSEVFVYNGLGMENWVDSVKEVIQSDKVEVVDSSKGITPIKSNDEKCESGQSDPHIWLSLKNAKIQAKNIKDALIKVDKKNQSFYETNYNEFSMELDKLYEEYVGKFKEINNKRFVTGHAAFAYLCREFGLEQNSVEDVFAEGEPSASRMKSLIEYCKKYDIRTIFVEDMVSPKVSKTLAKEVDAKTVKIYTLENKEDNKNYLESMRENLNKIYKSLSKK